MTRDDIICMAREAGLKAGNIQTEKFAKLIAAAEREACAKVCDKEANNMDEGDSWNNCASFLAKNIRARGKHD